MDLQVDLLDAADFPVDARRRAPPGQALLQVIPAGVDPPVGVAELEQVGRARRGLVELLDRRRQLLRVLEQVPPVGSPARGPDRCPRTGPAPGYTSARRGRPAGPGRPASRPGGVARRSRRRGGPRDRRRAKSLAGPGPLSGGASCRRSRGTPGGPAPGRAGRASSRGTDRRPPTAPARPGAGASLRGSGPGPTRCPRTGAEPAPTSDARGRSGPSRPPAPAGRSPGPRPPRRRPGRSRVPGSPGTTKFASSLPPHEMRFRAIARRS